jgi:hypothetical protein
MPALTESIAVSNSPVEEPAHRRRRLMREANRLNAKTEDTQLR